MASPMGKRALRVAAYALLGLVAAFALLVILDSLFHFSGVYFVRILSGSMEASGIGIGDVRLIVRSERYGVGDIIAFHKGGRVYFHEIVSLVEGGFVTKGSSNAAPDIGAVQLGDVIGRQAVDADLSWAFSPWFRIATIALAHALCMWACWSVFAEAIRDEKDQSEHCGEEKPLECPYDAHKRPSEARHVHGRARRGGHTKAALLALLFAAASLAAPAFGGWSAPASALAASQTTSFAGKVIDPDFEYNSAGGTVTGYDNGNGNAVIEVPSENGGTPVTSIGSGVFNNNPTVEKIIFPASVTSIGWLNFMNCPKLKEIYVYAENPICSFTSLLGWQIGSDVRIYVPDSVVQSYKSASGWSRYRSQIYPMSQAL